MRAGKYRNTVGAEITLTHMFLGPTDGNVWPLGEIWWAENGEQGILRQRWLVTRDGLSEAGYKLTDIEAESGE